MNTIQIKTEDGVVINYTEIEVLRYIKRVEELDAYKQTSIDNRYKVRDFFSEREWSDGETTISKSDVNELLESIGANKLTSTYTGTFIINGTFSVEAEDAESATSLLEEDINVEFYGGDIDVDSIDIHDMEEDN